MGGSVRPRGRSLRPDGVRTAQMRAWTDPRRGKGVKRRVIGPGPELVLQASRTNYHPGDTKGFRKGQLFGNTRVSKVGRIKP